MQHVIIDGYNVINTIPSLKKSLSHHPETARELLIHSVSQITYRQKFRATIVFDGSSPDSTHPDLRAPVHVVYSFPITADERIMQMIEQSKDRSKLIIISSDREILRFAKNYSCQTHTSKYLANLFDDSDGSGIEKSDQSLTQSQVNKWLKIFGEK